MFAACHFIYSLPLPCTSSLCSWNLACWRCNTRPLCNSHWQRRVLHRRQAPRCGCGGARGQAATDWGVCLCLGAVVEACREKNRGKWEQLHACREFQVCHPHGQQSRHATKTGAAGQQVPLLRSCLPKHHSTPAYEAGSHPSSAQRWLQCSAALQARRTHRGTGQPRFGWASTRWDSLRLPCTARRDRYCARKTQDPPTEPSTHSPQRRLWRRGPLKKGFSPVHPAVVVQLPYSRGAA